jgi:hypothetical protein
MGRGLAGQAELIAVRPGAAGPEPLDGRGIAAGPWSH